MRVLILHSRYLSGDASGENRVVEDEVQVLKRGGFEVQSWTPEVSDKRLQAASEAVWSRSAVTHVSSLVRSTRPDIVHVHSLYPRLSPAVLRAVDDLPLVMTLHNFRLQCLPATFLRDGNVCEACLGHVPWRGVAFGCYRGSRMASATLATSLTVHRLVRTFERVTRFLAVSAFARGKYIEAGIDAKRIIIKSNFATPTLRRNGPGDRFMTLGRLSPEKGLAQLVTAWQRAPLEVIGDGPDRTKLEALAPPNVTFVGSLPYEEIPRTLLRARALVYPSRCYEAQPRAILEAFAAGVPVIASRIGGLPEIVEHGVNGLLVDPDDAKGWQEAVNQLTDDSEAQRLGNGAYSTWETRFTPETGLQNLEDAYRDAASSHRAAR